LLSNVERLLTISCQIDGMPYRVELKTGQETRVRARVTKKPSVVSGLARFFGKAVFFGVFNTLRKTLKPQW
jgi:hypothetical protein